MQELNVVAELSPQNSILLNMPINSRRPQVTSKHLINLIRKMKQRTYSYSHSRRDTLCLPCFFVYPYNLSKENDNTRMCRPSLNAASCRSKCNAHEFRIYFQQRLARKEIRLMPLN